MCNITTVMDLRPARHVELFAAAEKDEQYFRRWIEDDVQEIAQRCLGVRRWVQFRSAITVLSRFGYFAISSIHSDGPTPGEEFCDTQSRSSSLTQRLATILLNNDLQLPREVPRPVISLIKDVHMITFFLFGDFYQLSKRLTGVTSVSADNGQSAEWNIINRLVGCLSIFRLMIDLPRQAELMGQLDMGRKQPENLGPAQPSELAAATGSKSKQNLHPDAMCQLCSSKRSQPTSTLCGHVFCWHCIHSWLRERMECPICRMPTEPSRLIHLINFR